MNGFSLAVVGAGPVGLGLAVRAAEALPEARVTLFDARPADADLRADPRTIALSLGSVQLLRRLGAWDAAAAQAIREVQVSQQTPAWRIFAEEPTVRIRAVDQQVEMLGAVLPHGTVVEALQRVWLAAVDADPVRLASRFGAPVVALRHFTDAVEVDAGIAERFDVAVIAEGALADPSSSRSLAPERPAIRRDYGQTAWVGRVVLEGMPPGVAFERFTRDGPVALLPLPGGETQDSAAPDAAAGARPKPERREAALVWCVARDDDPVRPLDDAARLALLATLLHRDAGRPVSVTPLKAFPLGLRAERSLTHGRGVRIGNAAQTLHPVAGQGLNLGLRDAFECVALLARHAGEPGGIDRALRRIDRGRVVDRWAMIAATDFLARSFTWSVPGLDFVRGFGLAALEAAAPVKSLLAERMMFGGR